MKRTSKNTPSFKISESDLLSDSGIDWADNIVTTMVREIQAEIDKQIIKSMVMVATGSMTFGDYVWAFYKNELHHSEVLKLDVDYRKRLDKNTIIPVLRENNCLHLICCDAPDYDAALTMYIKEYEVPTGKYQILTEKQLARCLLVKKLAKI